MHAYRKKVFSSLPLPEEGQLSGTFKKKKLPSFPNHPSLPEGGDLPRGKALQGPPPALPTSRECARRREASSDKDKKTNGTFKQINRRGREKQRGQRHHLQLTSRRRYRETEHLAERSYKSHHTKRPDEDEKEEN